jgi:type IV pilus assembly protein PilE
LVGIAVPSYIQWTRKANRGDAQAILLNMANNQEIWRAGNNSYDNGDNIGVPTHGKFTFSVPANGATTYTLRAVATGGQANDKEKGVPCTPMELNETGAKSPPVCWQE